MSDADNKHYEKIATANITNVGAVNICYVGGSRFEFQCSDGRKFRVDKVSMDKLIDENKVKLTAPKRYAEISESILPDGSTKTHNADGTPKTSQTKVLDELVAEGFIPKSPSQDGGEVRRKSRAASTQDNESDIVAPPTENKPTNNDTPADDPFSGLEPENCDANEANDNDNDNDNDQPRRLTRKERRAMAEAEEAENGGKNEQKSDPLAGDLNGDGIVDEFDELVEKEQNASPIVIIVVVLFALLSIFLFFFSHAGIDSIVHGNSFDLIPDKSEITNTQQDSEQQAPQNNDNGTQTSSQSESISKRDDFDPITAVSNFPEGSDDQQRIGQIIMQAIRTDVINGDVNGFNDAVDIEKIADQIAPAYANEAKTQQKLNDSEANELRDAYKTTFIQNEKQHVVDKDLNASLFGGRIRDIRASSDSNLEFYIVSESISGDHQRICFIVTGDGQNNWKITGIEDPNGYAKMIMEGPTSYNK